MFNFVDKIIERGRGIDRHIFRSSPNIWQLYSYINLIDIEKKGFSFTKPIFEAKNSQYFKNCSCRLTKAPDLDSKDVNLPST